MKVRICTAVFFSLLVGFARAEIRPAPLFGANGVLQRDKMVPVWGKANPGEVVTVEFKDQKVQAMADGSGRWRVDLAPMAASAEGSAMRLSGSESAAVTLEGILVGDVWFASGQSNMLHIVSKCQDFEAEKAAANYPLIRQFKVWFHASVTPEETIVGKPSKWSICQPGSVGSYAAVSYFFARDMHRELGVPIGIINSSWGGTQIESWMRESTLKASPYQAKMAERWKKFLEDYAGDFALYEKELAAWEEAEKQRSPDAKPAEKPREPQGAVSRWTPSGLFNAMVSPYIPYAIRGFIWYQGEANTARYDEYAQLFRALITDWRKDFAQGDLPFYFVQLANFDDRKDQTRRNWAFLREAQMAALSLPNTGAAVTVDIGNPADAHYGNKQEAARRLALAVLAGEFQGTAPASGPVFERADPDAGGLVLRFRGDPELVLRSEDPGAFEVAGEDKVFHPAAARLDGRTIRVSSPSVPRPVAVRYAWFNAPAVALFGATGLPAPPFRSDDWTPAPQTMGDPGVPDSGSAASE